MQKHVITEWYIENAGGQKNARSVRNANVQHATAEKHGDADVQHDAADVQSVADVQPSVCLEDAEKKEPVKNIIHANIAYSTAAPSGEPPSESQSESPSESSSDSSMPIPSICFLSMVCHVFVGSQGVHLS